MVTIQGNTAPHAAMLRQQGCAWDAANRYWICPSMEIARKITSPSWGRKSARDLKIVEVNTNLSKLHDALYNEGGEGYNPHKLN